MKDEKKVLEMLKKDLLKAIQDKNYARIEELKQLLNISNEQSNYFENGLTGYPSIDKPWLNLYPEGAESRAINIPPNKTIWDIIENKIEEYYDVPAIEYFGNQIAREDFRELCYTWARTFRALGVQEDEIVPIYGPFVPDICAMFFALNMIGACPYFLKLAMSKEALEEETKEAKIGIVYDGMWSLVSSEFSKDKYKNIIIATATANMPTLKRHIVSLLNMINAKKEKSKIPNDKKYIWIDRAREMANYYTGNVKVPFVKNRNAVITSSSGTTGGVVKGVIATNESVISQVYSTTYSDIPYKKGFRTLNHFPPTAATSLNSLFLVPLMNGATVLIDPRVTINDFYNQLVKMKPEICINTSSLWEAFFNRIVKEIQQGKKFDFDYAYGWMIGGEGTSVKKFKKWNDIMHDCNGPGIYGGYGLSETFSGISIDRVDVEPNYSKPIAGVGSIQAGMIAGIFDKDGRELSYNQRGELRVKTQTQMKGYYKKSQLTDETIVDGWIKTGDIAEIDDRGFLYVWGRMKDSIKIDNKEIYLFDIANKIREKEYIDDALVISMPTDESDYNLVAHIVWNNNVLSHDKLPYIMDLNSSMEQYLPKGVILNTYSEHETMIPYSPTTLKKDKNKLSHQTTGFIQVNNDRLENVEFFLLSDEKHYSKSENEAKRLVKRSEI